MKWVTRKEFSEIIGQVPAYVGTYIKRKKIIEIDKKIDIHDPTNQAFISKFTKNESEKQFAKEENPIQNNDTVGSKINQGNVDFIKKQFDIKKVQTEIKIKNLEFEKKKSKVLPIEFVIEWTGRNIKGTFSETVNFGNSIIENICNELDAPLEVKLKYKKQFKTGFNEILLESIKNQLPEALDYAKEYALINKW